MLRPPQDAADGKDKNPKLLGVPIQKGDLNGTSMYIVFYVSIKGIVSTVEL